MINQNCCPYEWKMHYLENNKDFMQATPIKYRMCIFCIEEYVFIYTPPLYYSYIAY